MIDLSGITDKLHGPEILVFNEEYLVYHHKEGTEEKKLYFRITPHNSRDGYFAVFCQYTEYNALYVDSVPSSSHYTSIIKLHAWFAIREKANTGDGVLYIRVCLGYDEEHEIKYQTAESWKAENLK